MADTLENCMQVFCSFCGNIKILIVPKKCSLIQHECMVPNWTQAGGFVLGVGVKMFTIAGPVIVYGVSASEVYLFLLLQ